MIHISANDPTGGVDRALDGVAIGRAVRLEDVAFQPQEGGAAIPSITRQ